MEMLKKYGKPAAIALIGLGLLLTLYAWYVSPKAFTAEIWMAGAQNPTEITVSDLIAANWLQEAGVRLYPGDSIIYSGVKIAPDFRLPVGQGQSLVYRMALPVTVNSPQGQYTFLHLRAHAGAGALGTGHFTLHQRHRLPAARNTH